MYLCAITTWNQFTVKAPYNIKKKFSSAEISQNDVGEMHSSCVASSILVESNSQSQFSNSNSVQNTLEKSGPDVIHNAANCLGQQGYPNWRWIRNPTIRVRNPLSAWSSVTIALLASLSIIN